MNKKDISIFLFAVLTVVIIYQAETTIPQAIITSYGYAEDVDSNVAVTYEEALSKAKKENKPIFIYFEADWCGYCKQMKKNVLSNKNVKKALLDNYVTLFVNIDEDQKTKSLFKIRSVPTYLIYSADEEILQKHSGYQDVNAFLDWLKPKNTISKTT